MLIIDALVFALRAPSVLGPSRSSAQQLWLSMRNHRIDSTGISIGDRVPCGRTRGGALPRRRVKYQMRKAGPAHVVCYEGAADLGQ
jgi:hypothetical protein